MSAIPSCTATATRAWLGNAEATRRIVRDKYQHLDGARKLTACVEENVLVQLENLRTHPVIAAGMARRTLNLHGWVYRFETGEVPRSDGTPEGEMAERKLKQRPAQPLEPSELQKAGV